MRAIIILFSLLFFLSCGNQVNEADLEGEDNSEKQEAISTRYGIPVYELEKGSPDLLHELIIELIDVEQLKFKQFDNQMNFILSKESDFLYQCYFESEIESCDLSINANKSEIISVSFISYEIRDESGEGVTFFDQVVDDLVVKFGESTSSGVSTSGFAYYDWKFENLMIYAELMSESGVYMLGMGAK